MQVRMKKVKENDTKWSQLPTPLLWMIRDLLFNFVDVVHLSLVCKDWKVALESYPFKSERRRLAPWIMQRHRTMVNPTTKCEFVNALTNEELILDLPELLKDDLIYSKQGWLLFRGGFQARRSLQRPVTLLHLYTNTRIKMSDPGDCVRGTIGCFSTSADGNPEVVIFDASMDKCITFCIAVVSDNNWIRHSYKTEKQMDAYTSLVLLENKVYYFEDSGRLCIFDLSNLVWKEIMVTDVMNPVETWDYKLNCGYSWIMVTSKSEIVKIKEVGSVGSFEYSKLNESTSGWEPLNNSDMEDKSWFISSRKNNQFIVNETGVMKKVYHVRSDPAWRNHIRSKIDIYDTSDGSVNSYRPNKEIHWVDLGKVFKVPPSCVGYEPPKETANDAF